MSIAQPTMDTEDMRDVDWQIVEILEEGRNNAPNIADRLGYTRQYIAERLVHLKTGDVVEPIGNGIYELVPEEVPNQE
jgi:GTP-sensing pleiotropic transcriptional regulator CodY